MVDNEDRVEEKSVETQDAEVVTSSVLSFDGKRLDQVNTKIATYDFRKPTQFSSLELVFLQQIYQDWLRSFRTYLTLTLKADIQVEQQQFEVVSFSEVIKRISDPSVTVLFGNMQSGSIGYWSFPTLLILEIVRKLLGGAGKVLIDVRPLTAIEKNLFLQFMEGCLDHFAKNIFSEIKLKNLKILGLEPGIRFIPKPSKAVASYLSQVVDWSLAEEKFSCGFAIPSIILEPILSAFREERSKLDPSNEKKKYLWRDIYKDIDIPVTAEWEKDVSVKDIMGWQEGTVLDFSMNTLERTIFKANGISKFMGTLGIESGRIVFNVGEKYERDE